MLPVGPRGAVSVRIIRPEHPEAQLPAIVYIHGGGWILGNKDTHDRLIRELANGVAAAVVFVNYSASPEARFPVAIEEVYAATKYVAENGESMGIDGSRIAIAGDSVGGGMTVAVSLLAKERGGPGIAFQGILYPVTNAAFDNASYKQFADGTFWLSRRAMTWFFDAYEPDHRKWKDIHISPLRATLDQLRGLPAALVITDENDVLRDEGEQFAHKLEQAGVRVTATRYLGTIHDFMMLNAFTSDPAPRAAIAQTISLLRAALRTDRQTAER
jgi:acetyl esterase